MEQTLSTSVIDGHAYRWVSTFVTRPVSDKQVDCYDQNWNKHTFPLCTLKQHVVDNNALFTGDMFNTPGSDVVYIVITKGTDATVIMNTKSGMIEHLQPGSVNGCIIRMVTPISHDTAWILAKQLRLRSKLLLGVDNVMHWCEQMSEDCVAKTMQLPNGLTVPPEFFHPDCLSLRTTMKQPDVAKVPTPGWTDVAAELKGTTGVPLQVDIGNTDMPVMNNDDEPKLSAVVLQYSAFNFDQNK